MLIYLAILYKRNTKEVLQMAKQASGGSKADSGKKQEDKKKDTKESKGTTKKK